MKQQISAAVALLLFSSISAIRVERQAVKDTKVLAESKFWNQDDDCDYEPYSCEDEEEEDDCGCDYYKPYKKSKKGGKYIKD